MDKFGTIKSKLEELESTELASGPFVIERVENGVACIINDAQKGLVIAIKPLSWDDFDFYTDMDLEDIIHNQEHFSVELFIDGDPVQLMVSGEAEHWQESDQ